MRRNLILWLFLVATPGFSPGATPPSSLPGTVPGAPVIVRTVGKVTLTRGNVPIGEKLVGITLAEQDRIKLETGALLEVRFRGGKMRVFVGPRFLVGSAVARAFTGQAQPAPNPSARESAAEHTVTDLKQMLGRTPAAAIGGVRGPVPVQDALRVEVEDALAWASPREVRNLPLKKEDTRDLEQVLSREELTLPDSHDKRSAALERDRPAAHEAVLRQAAVLLSWGQRRTALDLVLSLLEEGPGQGLSQDDLCVVQAWLESRLLPLTVRVEFERRGSDGKLLAWPGPPLRDGETIRFRFSAPFPVYWALAYWDGKTLHPANPSADGFLTPNDDGVFPQDHPISALVAGNSTEPHPTGEVNPSNRLPSREFKPALCEKVDASTHQDEFFVVATADPGKLIDFLALDKSELDRESARIRENKVTAYGSLVIRLCFKGKRFGK